MFLLLTVFFLIVSRFRSRLLYLGSSALTQQPSLTEDNNDCLSRSNPCSTFTEVIAASLPDDDICVLPIGQLAVFDTPFTVPHSLRFYQCEVGSVLILQFHDNNFFEFSPNVTSFTLQNLSFSFIETEVFIQSVHRVVDVIIDECFFYRSSGVILNGFFSGLVRKVEFHALVYEPTPVISVHSGTDLRVTNCSFIDPGVAITVIGPDAYVRVFGTLFTGTKTSVIRVMGPGTIETESCRFWSNPGSAPFTFEGGGFGRSVGGMYYANDAIRVLKDSQFHCIECHLEQSPIIVSFGSMLGLNGSYLTQGSTIHSDTNSSLSIHSTIFELFYYVGIITSANSSIVLNDVTLRDSRVRYPLIITEGSGSLIMRNSTCANNELDGGLGICIRFGATDCLWILNSSFVGNVAKKTGSFGGGFAVVTRGSEGGQSSSSLDLKITNSTFAHNLVGSAGGAGWFQFPSVAQNGIFDSNSFFDNTGKFYGNDFASLISLLEFESIQMEIEINKTKSIMDSFDWILIAKDHFNNTIPSDYYYESKLYAISNTAKNMNTNTSDLDLYLGQVLNDNSSGMLSAELKGGLYSFPQIFIGGVFPGFATQAEVEVVFEVFWHETHDVLLDGKLGLRLSRSFLVVSRFDVIWEVFLGLAVVVYVIVFLVIELVGFARKRWGERRRKSRSSYVYVGSEDGSPVEEEEGRS